MQLSGRKAIECFQDGLFQPTTSLSRACPSSAARAHWVAAWHVHQHHVCKSSWASSRSPRTSAGLAASAQMLRPSNRSCSPAASSAGRKVHGAQLQTWPRVRVRRSPRPASGATTLSSRVVSECSVAAAATFIACVGPARADGLASDAIQPMGSRSSISSPADGHKAVGLSFTGLVGLVSALAGCVPSRLQGSTGSFDGHCGVECADSWRVRTAS